MGDTEKEADLAGGSGDTEDGGMQGWRGEWEFEAWVWSDGKFSDVQKARQIKRHD